MFGQNLTSVNVLSVAVGVVAECRYIYVPMGGSGESGSVTVLVSAAQRSAERFHTVFLRVVLAGLDGDWARAVPLGPAASAARICRLHVCRLLARPHCATAGWSKLVLRHINYLTGCLGMGLADCAAVRARAVWQHARQVCFLGNQKCPTNNSFRALPCPSCCFVQKPFFRHLRASAAAINIFFMMVWRFFFVCC